ncbi:MAG: 2-oxo acid dehydrogenase subunit E2 [Acidiferrobacter sp.]
MKQPIMMPILSDTMETGRLVRWTKQLGEAIKTGENLAEVETDKAIMDVEAFADGFLAGPLAPINQDIPVRQIIGYISDHPEERSEAPPASLHDGIGVPTPITPSVPTNLPAGATSTPLSRQAPPTASPPPIPTAPSATGTPAPAIRHPGHHSPYARALAQDLGLDIDVMPTGPDGIVHATQVVAAMLTGPEVNLRMGPPYTTEQPTVLRAAVARNMAATVRTPVFNISARLAVGSLHKIAKSKGITLTLALARACARAVTGNTCFNDIWTTKGIARRTRVDIGIAIDTNKGLVTPVLRDAATRPLAEIAEDWRILRDKAARGRLVPEDYQGASFYLSNLGTFPIITHFNAIVPLGAAAILAVSASGDDGQADCTLSCDHRVIFGADAARFLTMLAKDVSEPMEWLQ